MLVLLRLHNIASTTGKPNSQQLSGTQSVATTLPDDAAKEETGRSVVKIGRKEVQCLVCGSASPNASSQSPELSQPWRTQSLFVFGCLAKEILHVFFCLPKLI